MFVPKFSAPIAECEICMKNGIRRELLPLVRLRGIGRVRARRLFNNGITTPEELSRNKKEDVVKILGAGIAEQVLEQLQPKRESRDNRPLGEDKNKNPGQSTLFHFR